MAVLVRDASAGPSALTLALPLIVIVGLLRGGEVALAPAPTVEHLDALLARHRSPLSRLTVSGEPRALPATVELSAYRIVEYLVGALTDQPVQVACGVSSACWAATTPANRTSPSSTRW